MAFTDLGTLGATGNTGNNQASLVLTTAAAAEAGELVVIVVADDNIGTGADADGGEVSGITDSGGNTGWQKAKGWTLTTGVAQAGASCSVWWCVLANRIANGGTITATFTNATLSDATGLTARHFSIAGNVVVSVEGTPGNLTNTAQDPGSLNVTTANIACLRIRGIAGEVGNNTSLTPTAGWTAWDNGNSATTGTTAEMCARAEHIISTGTSSASDPTWVSCDNASVYVAFKEVALPFRNLDWSPPKGAQPAIGLRTWTQSPKPPETLPFSQTDWPVPKGAPARSISLRTWTQSPAVTATAAADSTNLPAGVVDWGTPPPPARARDHLTWAHLSLALFAAATPFAQTDWVVPRASARSADLLTWTQAPSLALLADAAPAPFRPAEMPVPRGATRSTELRTWIQPKTAEVVDAANLPAGVTEWPVHTSRSRLNLSFASAPPLALTATTYVFRGITIAPVYRPAPRPRSLLTWTQGGSALYQAAPEAIPPGQSAQTLPRGAQRPRSLLSWVQGLSPLLHYDTTNLPAGVTNWGIPTGAQRRAVGFSSPPPLALLTTPPAPTPFAQYDWPVPRGAARPVSALTWTQSPTVPPSDPFVNIAWPVPRGALRPTNLLTWTQGPAIPPTIPFAQYDWPPPRGAARSVALLTWTTGFQILTAPAPVMPPLAQYDWPPPRGAGTARDMLNWNSTISLALTTIAPPDTPSTTDWLVRARRRGHR